MQDSNCCESVPVLDPPYSYSLRASLSNIWHRLEGKAAGHFRPLVVSSGTAYLLRSSPLYLWAPILPREPQILPHEMEPATLDQPHSSDRRLIVRIRGVCLPLWPEGNYTTSGSPLRKETAERRAPLSPSSSDPGPRMFQTHAT